MEGRRISPILNKAGFQITGDTDKTGDTDNEYVL